PNWSGRHEGGVAGRAGRGTQAAATDGHDRDRHPAVHRHDRRRARPARRLHRALRVVGHAQWIMAQAFTGLGVTATGVAAWIDVPALVGVLAVVALAALVPALRAGRLPASEAIQAGSGSRGGGRGLRVHRWLSGSRLPRPVSLGLALPFARPGRAGLTLTAVLLGVTSVTFATGLQGTFARLVDGAFGDRAVRVEPAVDADGRPVMN